MTDKKRSKISRQLQLYDTVSRIKSGAVYGPSDLMKHFGISLRMLQRDLKDLRDCGLISLKYNRINDRYVITDDSSFDETASIRRKQHLNRLYRIGTLIHCLSYMYPEEFDNYELGLREYEEYLEYCAENQENNTPEELEDMRRYYVPDITFYDLKAEYYALFPDSNERTRQRDFEEMCRAGFEIFYSRRYKSFIYLYQDAALF